MSPMSMTAEAARRALDAAKRNAQFVKRYLDGDRQAFAHMQGLMRAAYPDEGLGESPGAADDSESFSSAKTTAPMGDGTGEAMPRWLIEAGDAGFAPPKSPAHYKFEYAPNVEIDSEFDRLAREWMFKAELPAGWSTEIARDYQRRAAKPLSAAELAQERDAVLGRLRRHWGEETDAKLSQVRDLVHGVGDERLIETLNRSGLGNNEWPIRQLAIFADRKAMKAAEREKAEAGEEPEPSGDTGAGYRDIVYRQGDIQSSPYAQVAYKSGGDSIGETIDPEIVPVSSNEETGERRSVKHKDHSGGGRSGGGGWGEIEITGERPIAVIVDTPDGPYLMRDTRNGEIKVQRGKAARIA